MHMCAVLCSLLQKEEQAVKLAAGRCSQCREALPASFFTQLKESETGWRGLCHACRVGAKHMWRDHQRRIPTHKVGSRHCTGLADLLLEPLSDFVACWRMPLPSTYLNQAHSRIQRQNQTPFASVVPLLPLPSSLVSVSCFTSVCQSKVRCEQNQNAVARR